MMNKLFLILVTICFIASNDAARLSNDEQKLTVRGRAVFPSGARIPVESDGILITELVDTSVANAPAKTIGEGRGKAIRFPMAFAIKYSPKQVSAGRTYSLRVYIKNKNGKLLYTNAAQVDVKLLGLDRTKLIDIPVILVNTIATKPKRIQWPKLINTDGQEAVNIIKKQTGFTDVMTIKEGSMVTMDYRSNRVRVFVNDKGIVTRVPVTA